ncbi:MAG TPA: helix-turn-helix transcriptional regulator [Stellaceae bacterium]|nr:helix-turn-helix transcriptional regulator [Stellaceae bacterium]
MTGPELRAWRTGRQMTQAQLAAALGMSRARIIEYETERSRSGRSAAIPVYVALAVEALDRRERCAKASPQ